MKLRRISFVLAWVGALIATYVAYNDANHHTVACPTSGCEQVQHSFYSQIHGVPIASLGLTLYLAVIYCLGHHGLHYRLVEATAVFSGAIVSVFLICVQIFALHAICLWCIGSDSIFILLVPVAALRVWCDEEPPPVADADADA